jgi:YVTN family beta-propeller protein
VTNHGTGDLVAIDTQTHEITQTIEIGARPVGVQFDPSGERVYTTDFGSKSLDTPADSTFLLTGSFSTTDPGRIRVFEVESGEPVGEPITVGAGATSVVVLPYY